MDRTTRDPGRMANGMVLVLSDPSMGGNGRERSTWENVPWAHSADPMVNSKSAGTIVSIQMMSRRVYGGASIGKLSGLSRMDRRRNRLMMVGPWNW